MTTIVEFLTHRFDEIEAAARAATPGPWGTNSHHEEGFVTDSDGSYLVYSEGTVDVPTAIHIALHDPEFELKVIEANRKILAVHAVEGSLVSDYTDCTACMDVDTYDSYPCRTIRLMARPFADHPNYQAEWMP